MKVCAVIVTYGNRFNLLEKVIETSIREGVDKIIIVSNNSKSKEKLLKLEESFSSKIKVLYFKENLGSAGGFKKGMELAYKDNDCEFIWLLDDDNEPQKGSLRFLKEFWKSLEEKNKDECVALLSYRPDRPFYKESVITENSNILLGRRNSFLGFHILDIPRKIIRAIKRKLGFDVYKEKEKVKIGKIPVAPYGGFFFNKKLLKKIGYPREDFFVYADDHEWTYRIIKNGGSIYLVFDSIIVDLDKSWNFVKKGTVFSTIAKASTFRVYYSTRNRVVFELENLVDNKIIYYINIIVFGLILRFFANRKIYKVFKAAISDAKNGVMGKNYEDTYL